MKIMCITQARYSSTRLPGKVLKKLGSATVLDLQIKRLKKSKCLNKILIATTFEVEANEIIDIAKNNQVDFFRGSLEDVLDRYYQAALVHKPDVIVRVTSDCPLIDVNILDNVVEKFLNEKADYASNCLNPTLPDGMDVEVFTFNAIQEAWKNAKTKSEREHVTVFIRENKNLKVLSVEYPEINAGHLRLTLDTPEDYYVLTKVVESCGEDANLLTLVDFLENNSEIKTLNAKHKRNENFKR